MLSVAGVAVAVPPLAPATVAPSDCWTPRKGIVTVYDWPVSGSLVICPS